MNCYQLNWVSTPKGSRQVPCGKCLACLTNKRNDWAFRLEQEYKSSKGAAFITLTYHPKYCPDGLNKKHVQDYMKRLRKNYGEKLRYYLVGEYGTKTSRPHYHIILFYYDDLRLDKFITNAWRIKNRTTRKFESLGIVDIRNVNYARIMYCTKYVIQRGNPMRDKRSKPFMLCSRAYGLGAAYLTDQMANWHREGERNYTLLYGEKRRLPRYYKDKIWWPEIKRERKTVWACNPNRDRVSQQSKSMAIEAQMKNLQLLRDSGYSNPEAILTEMRNAVLSRVHQKVAFTQHF